MRPPLPALSPNGPPGARRRRSQRATGSQRARLVASSLVLAAVVGAGLGLLATVGTVRAISLYQSFASDLPSVAEVGTRPVFKTTRVLDRNGELIYELFDPDKGKRTVVRLGDLPQVLIDAVLAVEDASFYENPGIEVRGILRAFWQNLTSGSIVAGGSTITQQLIRNVLLSPEERTSTTLERKLKEAVLALELSRNYTKDQILEMYLNEIYFGNLSYGIETASRTYFDKSARELTLPEAALLAGLPQAPASYDPFRHFEAAKRRQESVLDLMARHRFISRAQAEAGKAHSLQFVTPSDELATMRYPHWAAYVRFLLEEQYGPKELLAAGLTVTTTLDSHLQEAAEDTVRRHLRDLAAQNATNAGLVAIDPTSGEILAMVGSPDFYDASIDGQVNAAVAERQPGSAIKPIVYTAAFLKGFSPATVVRDEPISFRESTGQVWRPQNFDNRFRGPVTLRRALGNSLNIPAVKVLQYVGVSDGIEFARTLGMTSLGDPLTYGLAFTLGGGEVRLVELTAAYGVLANGGVRVPTTAIRKIVDSEGRTVYEYRPAPERVVDPRAAWLVTDILSDNNARLETFGASSPLRLSNNRPAAAKTGSTDSYRDSWTIGYTPSLVAGVWVGRADNQPMRLVLGSSGAGRIWNTFMERAYAGWPNEPFPQPPGLARTTVCAATGLAPTEECEGTVTDWIIGDRPARTGRAIAIDRVTGKLAGPNTPYRDVVFQRFGQSVSGEGPFPPTEYSDRSGATRPWEVLPAPAVPTTTRR